MLYTHWLPRQPSYRIPLTRHVEAGPPASQSCALRSFSVGAIRLSRAHLGLAASGHRQLGALGVDVQDQAVQRLPSAKQILEQGAFPLLGWQNQIGRREPSVIRDARAFVENVVRMSRSLYERRIGIGPVIHVHDAAAAVDEKNNSFFA